MTGLGFLLRWNGSTHTLSRPRASRGTWAEATYERNRGKVCPPPPKSIAALLEIGSGYSLYVTALETPIKHWSEERKLKNRKQRLRRRIETKWPLLAEQMIADEVAKRGWTE